MKDQPVLRLVVDNSGGYRSGLISDLDMPDSFSSESTRSAGTPPRRHLSTACGEIPNALASAPSPPDDLIARSTTVSMMGSQPQVEAQVNLRLLVNLNPRFHPDGMSPVGKIIKSRLKQLGKTQAWLAEKLGVSENAVSKWIKSGEIKRENAEKMAPIIELSLDQLLGQSSAIDPDAEWRTYSPILKAQVIAMVRSIRGASIQAESGPRPQKKG